MKKHCKTLIIVPLLLMLMFGFQIAAFAEELTFLSYGAWRVHPGWDDIITGFEEETGIPVTIIYAPPQQIYDKLVAMLAGRTTDVDVIVADSMWMPSFIRAGFLKKLDDDVIDKDEFLAAAIEAYSDGDDLYAVPSFAVAGFTFWRKDLFEAAGLDPNSPPTTWEELLKYAQILTADTEHGKQWGYGYCGLDIGCDFLEFMWQAGGDVLDGDGNVTVNDPAVVEALEFFVDLRNEYKVVPPGVSTYMPEDLNQMFQAGQLAMMRNWPYVWAIYTAEDSPLKDKVGLAPNPGYVNPTGTTFGAWGLAVPANSQHSEAAELFIKYVTKYESQKLLFLEGGEMPSMKAVYDDPDVLAEHPMALAMLEALEGAFNRPLVPENQEVLGILGRAWQEALVGAKTPQKALDDAARAIEAILR